MLRYIFLDFHWKQGCTLHVNHLLAWRFTRNVEPYLVLKPGNKTWKFHLLQMLGFTWKVELWLKATVTDWNQLENFVKKLTGWKHLEKFLLSSEQTGMIWGVVQTGQTGISWKFSSDNHVECFSQEQTGIIWKKTSICEGPVKWLNNYTLLHVWGWSSTVLYSDKHTCLIIETGEIISFIKFQKTGEIINQEAINRTGVSTYYFYVVAYNSWNANPDCSRYKALSKPPDKRVYLKIIFLISQPKHMLWVLKRSVSMSQLDP